MLPSFRLDRTLFPLAILALASNLTATSGSWTVVPQPGGLVNGSPVLFRVLPPRALRALSADWMGHTIVFSFAPGNPTWFALAGVSQETKPGTYTLDLHAETTAGQAFSFQQTISVRGRRYPRVQLKVPARYTAPSPEERGEIAQNKTIKAEAFSTVTANRAWQGSFAAPVRAQISDVFGVERVFNGSVQSTHQGLDFRVPTGTPVVAVNSGRVLLARPLFFEGNCIVIDHGQGLLTLYLHLSKFLVKEGDHVTKAQPIGLSGGTGRATGPHLHLAVRWQGVYLNPQALLALKLP